MQECPWLFPNDQADIAEGKQNQGTDEDDIKRRIVDSCEDGDVGPDEDERIDEVTMPPHEDECEDNTDHEHERRPSQFVEPEQRGDIFSVHDDEHVDDRRDGHPADINREREPVEPTCRRPEGDVIEPGERREKCDHDDERSDEPLVRKREQPEAVQDTRDKKARFHPIRLPVRNRPFLQLQDEPDGERDINHAPNRERVAGRFEVNIDSVRHGRIFTAREVVDDDRRQKRQPVD